SPAPLGFGTGVDGVARLGRCPRQSHRRGWAPTGPSWSVVHRNEAMHFDTDWSDPGSFWSWSEALAGAASGEGAWDEDTGKGGGALGRGPRPLHRGRRTSMPRRRRDASRRARVARGLAPS